VFIWPDEYRVSFRLTAVCVVSDATRLWYEESTRDRWPWENHPGAERGKFENLLYRCVYNFSTLHL